MTQRPLRTALATSAAAVLALLGVVGCGPHLPASCPSGHAICGFACVDLATDRAHCGGCDTACNPGELCVAGACTLTCPTGEIACDGRCVDPATSTDHCGATGDCQGSSAGAACAGGRACAAGACTLHCPEGQVLCGNTCVDPRVDADHCGASDDCRGPNRGEACNLGEACIQGACQLSCHPFEIECDGVCVDPLTAPQISC